MSPHAPGAAGPAIGIDVGGTKIAAALVDRSGTAARTVRRPTPATGRAALLAALADIVAELRSRSPLPVAGVGVGTGGVVDHGSGVVRTATDLLPDWAGTPVGPWLADRCGLPVAADNDGNTHALGELRFGAAQGYADVLFAAVGTGVGGALALGGALRRGRHHIAGEIGHAAAPGAKGRRCSCGGTGHLEAVAAGPAIAARYRELGGAALDLPAIAARAHEGDAAATAAVTEAATALGATLAGLATALDPEAVVLGGGVAEMGPLYWEPLRAAFTAEPYMRTAGTALLAARLGGGASIAGAAALILDRLHGPCRGDQAC